jgi:hypothetical protein
MLFHRLLFQENESFDEPISGTLQFFFKNFSLDFYFLLEPLSEAAANEGGYSTGDLKRKKTHVLWDFTLEQPLKEALFCVLSGPSHRLFHGQHGRANLVVSSLIHKWSQLRWLLPHHLR